MCESFLEKRVFTVLLAHPNVRDLREQPAAIVYVDELGHLRDHTFDCIVEFDDGTRLAVVVKPAKIAERDATKRLIRLLAAHLPAEVADGVIVMTEDDAGPEALHNARLVNSARLHPNPEHDAVLRDYVLGMTAETTIAEIRRGSGLAGFALRSVARLLFDGTLVQVTPGRIASSTAVRRASAEESGT